jgi:hypothetical protein
VLHEKSVSHDFGAQRLAIVIWGVGGVALLFAQAAWRLGALALEPLRSGHLEATHLLAYAASLAFMGYTEGYRTFQRQMAPRVVKRALYLAERPRWLHVLAAPAFCMGLFHATRRRLLTSWSVVALIIVLVSLVRMVPQPWRGIIDAGVVLGLAWGIVAMVAFAVRALNGGALPGSADLPNPSGAEGSVAAS